MFIIGLCIHIVFLLSIFDIYFKSPIVVNVVPYKPFHDAFADRLVLIVIDGLRAESFVNYTTMPYLRTIANSKGRWGISNTRVPTESRPGHVAIIAGLYEDPSAVAKGWKENPVDFDTVFNKTTFTWCWGAYDIVEIFTKGNVGDHVFANKFDPYDQAFSTDKNTTLLDSWVFDNVKQFFLESRNDEVLNSRLKEKKIAFFLHLLGTDTSGHTHKPKTRNFLTTVQFVDNGIKEIEKFINNFYGNDGRTTFLVTSDHGMTDWGSHGAGDLHETETPYVLWGAGVQQKSMEQLDPSTLDLSLNHRHDVYQADLTPLMSTILSIPVPVNSVGRLPLQLLNSSRANIAKAFYSNSRQLASQYYKKRLDVEANAISILYQPFKLFDAEMYSKMIDSAETSLRKEDYDRVIDLSDEIINFSLLGLNYYHNYYQRPLLVLVTLSFVGWIVCLLKVLLEQKMRTQIGYSVICKHRITRGFRLNITSIVFLSLCLISFYLVHAQKLPLQYHVYFLMPILLWRYVFKSMDVWLQIFKQVEKNKTSGLVILEVICYIVGCIAMALSFTYRWMLSIPLIGMGLWPFFSSMPKQIQTSTLCLWTTGCGLLSLFSCMPVVGKDVFIELVILAGLVWLTVVFIHTWAMIMPLYRRKKEGIREIILAVIQTFLLIAALINVYVQSKRFESGSPVSTLYQVSAWIIAVISLGLPLTSSKRFVYRLLVINNSILTFYLLLSVAHEGLFMVVLISNTICWILIEYNLLGYPDKEMFDFKFDKGEKRLMFFERSITMEDFRRAFFFLLYIIIAFFGTGNIASLNSFEVRWVTCFLTSYHPFLITALILLKTLSPFLSVACSFRAVQLLSKAPTDCLYIIVLIYSNIMGIQLLYFVKNTGSWLEIGTSISQFVIVQVITVFIVLINQIARTMTDINILNLLKGMIQFDKKVD